MGSAKRVLLLAAVATVMLFALVSPAFAGGYLNWGVVSNLYGNPGSTSPHVGYTTTTVKCQVCHAVHYANAAGQLLLNSSVSGACNYCHLNSASGYSQVYASDPNNYNVTDIPTAHNGVAGGVFCSDCHQVHAAANAMTANTNLTAFMLKAIVTTDPVGQPLAGEATFTAMSKWCSNCHYNKAVNGNASSGASMAANQYYNSAFNGPSHIMTSTIASYNNTATSITTQVAWQSSAQCMNCHRAGTWSASTGGNLFNSYLISGANYDFPHYTLNAANFLESAIASGTGNLQSGAVTGDADGVCLACHRFTNGATTTGIGINF